VKRTSIPAEARMKSGGRSVTIRKNSVARVRKAGRKKMGRDKRIKRHSGFFR
jgi:hypothetical protein